MSPLQALVGLRTMSEAFVREICVDGALGSDKMLPPMGLKTKSPLPGGINRMIGFKKPQARFKVSINVREIISETICHGLFFLEWIEHIEITSNG